MKIKDDCIKFSINTIKVLNKLGLDVNISKNTVSSQAISFDLRISPVGVYFIHIDNTIVKVIKE